MEAVIIMVVIVAVFSFLLSNPTFVRVVSWLIISALTCVVVWVSFKMPEIPLYHALVGSLIFLVGAGGSYWLATKVMASLWPDMMIEGVIGQGKQIFVARFWTGLWSFLVPVAAAAIIGGIGSNAYYSKVVDGYSGFSSVKESKRVEKIDGLRGAEEPSVSIVRSESLNMRSGPGTSNSVISKLTKGQQVILLSDLTMVDGAEWALIKAGDAEGWVDTKYLAAR